MDSSELIIHYTASDFAQALRALLPKGKYWQDPENVDLRQLIEGMGEDFKITHDEIQLSFLNDMNDGLFGWRISDYQTLLDTYSAGRVYDNISTPNLISVELSIREQSAYDAWLNFERKRLPHTDINWILNTRSQLIANFATFRYIKKYTRYDL